MNDTLPSPNMTARYESALLISVMLKKTQLTITITIAYTCLNQFGAFSRYLPYTYFSSISSTPKYAPQSTKFQLAPCHRPVRDHTISRFRMCLCTFTLFPPSGMYTYSRNQVESDMCHLRQKSVIVDAIYG